MGLVAHRDLDIGASAEVLDGPTANGRHHRGAGCGDARDALADGPVAVTVDARNLHLPHLTVDQPGPAAGAHVARRRAQPPA